MFFWCELHFIVWGLQCCRPWSVNRSAVAHALFTQRRVYVPVSAGALDEQPKVYLTDLLVAVFVVKVTMFTLLFVENGSSVPGLSLTVSSAVLACLLALPSDLLYDVKLVKLPEVVQVLAVLAPVVCSSAV